MRLSAVLELPEFKKREITIIGSYNTGTGIVAVLARTGEKLFPYPKLCCLVEDGPDNPDPELDQPEINAILRRFGFFDAISTFTPEPPSK
jgi:hypothetical protein